MENIKLLVQSYVNKMIVYRQNRLLLALAKSADFVDYSDKNLHAAIVSSRGELEELFRVYSTIVDDTTAMAVVRHYIDKYELCQYYWEFEILGYEGQELKNKIDQMHDEMSKNSPQEEPRKTTNVIAGSKVKVKILDDIDIPGLYKEPLLLLEEQEVTVKEILAGIIRLEEVWGDHLPECFETLRGRKLILGSDTFPD
jgi:hypothetical protein